MATGLRTNSSTKRKFQCVLETRSSGCSNWHNKLLQHRRPNASLIEILIQQDEREPYRVRVARAFISSHQTEDFSLSDLARSVHVCPFYLCKIFKKATGLTFIEFRNRLRIESAKKLLVNPNLSVSEIAYRVGFQSLTQFNRLFRRIVGQSPTGLRRDARENGTVPSLKEATAE